MTAFLIGVEVGVIVSTFFFMWCAHKGWLWKDEPTMEPTQEPRS